MTKDRPDPNDTEAIIADEYNDEPLPAPEDAKIAKAAQEPSEGSMEAAHGPVGEYAPYDLEQVRPSIFDPVDAEGNPDHAGQVRLRGEDGNLLPEFDPKYREDFHGLAFVGAISKTFEWLGHKFTIRTLTVDEALNVALLTKQYADTIGNGLSYRTATAALAVQAVDGQDLPIPVGDSGDFAYAQQRFDFAKARWFQFTIDAIYNEYLELETKVREVIVAMGKASAPSGSMSG